MNNDTDNPQPINDETEQSLIYLMFASSAVKKLDHQELSELSQQAERKNQKLGITGQLIYDDGNFLSVLEGQAESVQQLFQAISHDSRHHGLILIHEGALRKRVFSNWSMDYHKHKQKAGQRLSISSAIGALIDRYNHN
ncbi:MAG: hypothetical protein CTY19_02890 [Methylomonas sp.]|nr:MAG: hypothetical protein CTY19_02890 [Methylomonas sp.]